MSEHDHQKKDKKDKKDKKQKKEKKPHHQKHGKHGEDLSTQLHELVLAAPVPPQEHFENGDEVWEHLKNGNTLFTSGHFGGYLLSVAHGIAEDRKNQAKTGQHPPAIVVSCSDSRVPPELVFNQGIGDLFVVRVAGNVVDPVALGSIEYAVEHLHSKLILVLGHQKCGACKAAIDSHGTPADDSNIPSILNKIYPAVEYVKSTGCSAEDTLDGVVKQNVRNTKADILKNSKIVAEHVDQKLVSVLTAEYSIDTGIVDVVN